MKKLNTLVIALGLIAPIAIVQASDVQIEWGDFEKFTDVDPAQDTRTAFHDRIKRSLGKEINKLSDKFVSAGQLQIKFKDIDLAGDVRHGIQNQRIVERVDIPRMEFDYSVVDEQGVAVKQGSAKIKDMAFLDQIHNRKINYDNFYYEKKLLEDWFKAEFASR